MVNLGKKIQQNKLNKQNSAILAVFWGEKLN